MQARNGPLVDSERNLGDQYSVSDLNLAVSSSMIKLISHCLQKFKCIIQEAQPALIYSFQTFSVTVPRHAKGQTLNIYPVNSILNQQAPFGACIPGVSLYRGGR